MKQLSSRGFFFPLLIVFSLLLLSSLVQSQPVVNKCPTQCDLSALIPTTGGKVVLGPAGANITVNSTILISVNSQQKLIEVTSAQPNWKAGTVIVLYQATGAKVDTTTPNTSNFGKVTNIGNAGNWEFVVITGVASPVWQPPTQFYIRCAPIHAYEPFQGVAVEGIVGNTVELLAGVTLTATGWRSATNPNPVIPVVANNLILGAGASISATGKGFLGGVIAGSNAALVCPTCNCKQLAFNYGDSTWAGRRGGSIASQDPNFDPVDGDSFGRGAVANGGGGGNNHNAPGGGGANGWRSVGGKADTTPWTGRGIMNPAYEVAWLLETTKLSNSIGGGRGGYSYSNDQADPLVFGPNDCSAWEGNARLNIGGLGGRPVAYFTGNSVYSKLFLGGGGGAGHNNDWLGGNGGNGGGLVIVVSNNVQGDATNSIAADGLPGDDSKPSLTGPFDGPGGGGAGGSIFFVSYNLYDPAIKFSAIGAKGGNNVALATEEAEGGGGGGGGGVISFVLNVPALRTAGITRFGCTTARIAGGINGVQVGQDFMQTFPPNGATSGAPGQCLLVPNSIPCLASISVTPTRTRTRSLILTISVSRDPLISLSPSNSVLLSPSSPVDRSPFPSVVGNPATGGVSSTTGRRGTTGGGSGSTTGRQDDEEEVLGSTTGRKGTTGQVRRRTTTGGNSDDDSSSAFTLSSSLRTLLISIVFLVFGRMMM